MGNKNLGMIILIATMAQATWARLTNDLLLEQEKISLQNPEIKVHVVGDDKGWDLGVDYKAWAASRDIRAGDKLYFRYDRTKHDVYRVQAKQFEECSTVDPIGSWVPGCGSLSFILTNLGDQYYISGAGNDCQSGMKVHIFVKEKNAP